MITFGLRPAEHRLPALDVVIGFGLFRLFDIVKPFPIRRLERLKGGMGVMADDVGAGIYALVLLTDLAGCLPTDKWPTSRSNKFCRKPPYPVAKSSSSIPVWN